MTQPQVVHCQYCIFFNRFTIGHLFLGYCQFNAPILNPKVEHKHGQFPIVKETDFCGQGELPEPNQVPVMGLKEKSTNVAED